MHDFLNYGNFYMPQKCQKTILCHHVGSFKLKMHQNPISAWTPPRIPLGSLRRSLRPHSQLGRGHPLPIHLPSTPLASRLLNT